MATTPSQSDLHDAAYDQGWNRTATQAGRTYYRNGSRRAWSSPTACSASFWFIWNNRGTHALNNRGVAFGSWGSK